MKTAPQGVFVRQIDHAGARSPGGRCVLALRVQSRVQLIEHVVEVVAGHCLELGLSRRSARFNLRVALAEALSNAMEYGNGLDADKLVDVTAEEVDGGVQVQVRDEGTGFNPDKVPDPTQSIHLEHPAGRGLFLIRKLVDEVSFNDEGNTICMTWRCS